MKSEFGDRGEISYSCCLIRFIWSLRSVPPTAAAVRRAAAPYKVQIIRHRSHKSSRLNAALAGLVDGRAVMGISVCGRMNLS